MQKRIPSGTDVSTSIKETYSPRLSHMESLMHEVIHYASASTFGIK